MFIATLVIPRSTKKKLIARIMRQNPDTNIFACFVSYPSFAASVSEQTKDEVIRKGDMFRSYIWGEAGFDRFMKRIPYSNYGQDLKRILFQFYVLPCDYERMHISDIENYRKREKAIGISIIIENDFFNIMTHKGNVF